MATEFYQRTPGRRQDQVQRDANSLAKKAGLFERRLELTAPGDVNVDPRMMLALSGTGTGCDQQYFIMSVTFAFEQPQEVSEYGGCTMTIDAANMDGSRTDSAPVSPATDGTGPETQSLFGTSPSGTVSGSGGIFDPPPKRQG